MWSEAIDQSMRATCGTQDPLSPSEGGTDATVPRHAMRRSEASRERRLDLTLIDEQIVQPRPAHRRPRAPTKNGAHDLRGDSAGERRRNALDEAAATVACL